jgi:hypothetical protein
VKRSQSVKRVLLGGLSAGALTACALTARAAPVVAPESYYANNDLIPGAGYYHAPFRAFYPHPYNHYDNGRKMYFYGGQWGAAPHRSIVNISVPTPEAVRAAAAVRTDQPLRSGFGSTSGSHSIRS